MNKLFRLLRFYYLNDRWARETLRRWKKEGRIPKDYYGSLRGIAFFVEAQYENENEKRQRL